MSPILIALIAFAALALLVLLVCYVCFYIVFYVSRGTRRRALLDKYPVPDGDEYRAHTEDMISAIRRADLLDYREYTITSEDGLALCARYYEHKKGAPIELMLHGYRGSARRDMSAGIFRAAKVGHNAFVVDHRASGASEGHVISFGVKESRDCLDWLNFIIKEFGDGVEVMLTGISMGAATVLLCTAQDLPKNVIGVLADCGYSSAKEIIKKVITNMHLPAALLYPFVRLGGIIFGGFDINEADARRAVKSSRVPVIFYHGSDDNFVPCDMSKKNYKACASKKKLVIIPGAPHGLSYLIEPEMYISTFKEFCDKYCHRSK